MSLREDVARRFGRLHGHNDDSPDMVNLHPVFLLCADEAIRFAEYARRCVGISGPTTIETTKLVHGEVVPYTKEIAPAVPYLPELTLPPEDWKP